jgi:hypothetical protein
MNQSSWRLTGGWCRPRAGSISDGVVSEDSGCLVIVYEHIVQLFEQGLDQEEDT